MATRIWAALILVPAISLSSAVAAQERINYPAAGIALDRPAGWHDATFEQVQANREHTRLSDPQLQRAIAARSAMPLFVFTKYPEPHAGLNPTVQVTLRPALPGAPTDLLAVALEPMRRGLSSFRVVSPVQAANVAGSAAAHVRAAYTLQNSAGQQFAVLSRLWLVPRGRLLFLIGMSGSNAGPDLCEEEFAAVLASIEIEK